jgi:DNA sulfur modification protein DndB
MKLALIPKLFKFRDWAELPPEQRAQRVIQKSRIPEITQYILDNEDGYLFSSLTASYNTEPVFTPIAGNSELGQLQMPFEADLVINDGQHRRAAIEEALKENPTLGQESISVVLFPWEDIDRVQQMFSDLNRTARKTSKSLDILYNHRDLLSQVALTVSERVAVFRNNVDKDLLADIARSAGSYGTDGIEMECSEPVPEARPEVGGEAGGLHGRSERGQRNGKVEPRCKDMWFDGQAARHTACDIGIGQQPFGEILCRIRP